MCSMENEQSSKRMWKRTIGLSWFKHIHSFPDFGDTQHCNGEYIIENDNENHVYMVTQMYIAIAILH